MTVTRHVFKTRAEWLTARRAFGLGGSDAATLCGVGYGSEYELWGDKCGLWPIEEDDASLPEYVEAGTFMEPAILAWWQHRTGLVAEPTPLTIFRNDEFPWMFASTDALVGEDEGLDAKNADRSRAEDFAEGVPMGHQVQAQHYMAVTGRRRWHFAVVLGGNKLLPAVVDRNDRFIAALVERERAWWERHVVGKSPPEPDGSEGTTRALKRAWPHEDEGEVAPLDASFLALRDRLLAAQTEATLLEEEIRGIKNKVQAAIGSAAFGALPDGSGWSWKSQERAGYVVEPTTSRPLCYRKPPKEKAR